MNDMLKDELYHKWTDAMKANYNREYYQKHKDWWKTKYADFTGGVKRATANAKTAAKNELRRTEDRVWDARQALKGETPQSLWKSGARDIRKKLEPHAKKAKALWDDGANDIRDKADQYLKEGKKKAKTAKNLWDDGAKDIRDKADPYLKEGKKKAKSAKNLWDDGATDIKSKAGKAAASAQKGAKKLSSQLQKNGKRLMSDIKKNSPKALDAGKKAYRAMSLASPVTFLASAAAESIKSFGGELGAAAKRGWAKGKKKHK